MRHFAEDDQEDHSRATLTRRTLTFTVPQASPGAEEGRSTRTRNRNTRSTFARNTPVNRAIPSSQSPDFSAQSGWSGWRNHREDPVGEDEAPITRRPKTKLSSIANSGMRGSSEDPWETEGDRPSVARPNWTFRYWEECRDDDQDIFYDDMGHNGSSRVATQDGDLGQSEQAGAQDMTNQAS